MTDRQHLRKAIPKILWYNLQDEVSADNVNDATNEIMQLISEYAFLVRREAFMDATYEERAYILRKIDKLNLDVDMSAFTNAGHLRVNIMPMISRQIGAELRERLVKGEHE